MFSDLLNEYLVFLIVTGCLQTDRGVEASAWKKRVERFYVCYTEMRVNLWMCMYSFV